MEWHEIKDLTAIYSDYKEDNYKVVVWDPVQQKHYNLVFTGSSHPDKEIHFNITEVAETEKEKKKLALLNNMISIHNHMHHLQELLDKLNKEYEDQKD